MFRVKLLQPEIDYQTGRVIARQEILEGNYRGFFDIANKDKEFDLSIRRHRNKRSLDANAYYHVLVSKIASAVGSSMQEIKNQTIARYGQMDIDENGKPVYMIVRDDMPVELFAEVHLAPTTQTKDLNGVLYRVYHVMRGSHELNSKEMSDLISGTISDARDAGLSDAEIMTPKELEMLENVYGIRIGGKA